MDNIGYINVVLETFGALFSLLVVVFVSVGEHEPDRSRASLVRLLVCNAAVLLCDACSWLLEGSADPVGRTLMELTTFGMFSLSYVRLALFTDYIAASIAARGQKPRAGTVRLMWAVCALAIASVAVSLLNGMFYRIDAQGMYVRGPLIGLSHWFGALFILINGWLLARYRKAFTVHELFVLGLCVILPAVALALQQAFYGISFLNMAATLVAILLYLGVQMEQERAIHQQTLELERCRARLAMSQIHPKFLFRALDAIHDLCAADPPAAKEALRELAVYLRANTDALSCTRPVPLSLELAHVRSYLALERRCLGDRLTVEYAVDTEDFAVPALSLQFLVERAVQRRCVGEASRGSVRISAQDEGRSWRASVRDVDALPLPGGDPIPPPAQTGDPNAFTLEGMRTWVALLQGGTLETGDVPGGTVCSIVVPKGGGR
ncbi:sensor histidine kinase [Arabiibacter massiliensis]|uniref:sensor histidine kinase n=1 Tax=Arabiibacter massiliensis TaxID=1870985 RepID=UPI0009BBAE25|nr:histidine kinase [Arabiibacter massiliensis]